MKIHASLIPTCKGRAQPSLLAEYMFDEHEDYNEYIQLIWEHRLSKSKFKLEDNRLLVYDEDEVYINILVKNEFVICLKDYPILLIDFHIWIINKYTLKEINKFFATVFLNCSRFPTDDEVTITRFPFLNIKNYTLWEKLKGT